MATDSRMNCIAVTVFSASHTVRLLDPHLSCMHTHVNIVHLSIVHINIVHLSIVHTNIVHLTHTSAHVHTHNNMVHLIHTSAPLLKT